MEIAGVRVKGQSKGIAGVRLPEIAGVRVKGQSNLLCPFTLTP